MHSTRIVPGSRTRPTARHAIAAIAVVTFALVAINAGPLMRQARFLWNGTVHADGMTLHLDPKDEMITRIMVHDGTWEESETSVLRGLLRRGDTFVDVGANIGWYTLVASKVVGDEGRVIAFEPAPESYGLLCRNARENGCRNATLEQKALSDKRGSLRLYLGATNKGHNSIVQSAATSGAVDVEALPLDEYLAGFGGQIALVKIDTEGAEGFILKGMSETLRRNPRMAIIMEYHPALLRRAGFDPAAILRDFHDSGYEVYAIEPGHREMVPVREPQISPLTASLERNNAFVNVLLKPRPAK